MYLTILDKLVELLVDIGGNGFYLGFEICHVKIFTIDTSWIECILTLVGIVLLGITHDILCKVLERKKRK